MLENSESLSHTGEKKYVYKKDGNADVLSLEELGSDINEEEQN
jgi:hypothetical protein